MKAEEILELVRYYTGDHSISRFAEINEAYRDILKQTKWWFSRIEDENLITLIANVYRYQVDFSGFRGGSPTNVYISSVTTSSPSATLYGGFRYGENVYSAVSLDNGPWTLIEEVQQKEYARLKVALTTTTTTCPTIETTGCPTNYILSGNTKFNFCVTPTPSTNMSIRFEGIKAIDDLDRGVEPTIHKDYHVAIALLASGFILQRGIDPIIISKGARLEQRARIDLKMLIEDVHPNRLENLQWDTPALLY